MSGLPHGWAIAPAGELGDWRGGGTPSKSNDAFWTSGTIPWVSPKDMKRQYISDAEDHITEAAVAGSATQRVPENSILMVTRSGILQHSLPVAINTVPVTVNQDLKTLTPFEGILPEYILWHLKADAKPILEAASKTGTTVESIDFDRLKAYPIRLAPLQEQKRIVAKVDGLTARTARARADLDRIPTLIARYKQRLLALAFSGELTAGWRNENPNLVQVARKNVGDLLTDIVGGKNLRCVERPPNENEQGVVKVSAVTWGRFDPQASKTLPANFEPPEKTRIRKGDLLISRANTLELVAAVVIVDEAPSNLFLSDKVLRLEMRDQDKPWLLWFLRSPDGRAQIEASATGNQLSMRNLSQSGLRGIELPWPSYPERAEIVRRIESTFNWLDQMAADHFAAAKLLPQLDAAILAKAFRGELVPQDPNDEPASALLARIKGANAYSDAKTATRANRVRRLEKTKSDAPMNKTRNDSNVRGKPYLTAILRERKAPITPNELHSLSGLPLHEFYHQLAQEYDEGWLREVDGRVGVA